MKNLLKTLKRSYIFIIGIIILLVIQAFLELELPSYTSSIINIGINNSGIEKITPTVISQSEFDNIMLFVSKEDKEVIKNNYIFISKYNITKEDYIKYKNKYPIIDDDNLYILNNSNKNVSNKIDSILNQAITIYAIFSNNDLMTKYNFNLNESPNDVMSYLKTLDETEVSNLVTKITNNELFKMAGNNVAVNYLKSEYTKVGVDVTKVQTNYVIKNGAIMLGISLVIMLCASLVGLLGAVTSARLGCDLRKKIFNKVLSFSMIEVKKYGVSSLVTRSTNDINQVQMMIVMAFRTIVFAPIMAIGAIIKVMSSNVSMTYIIAMSVTVVISTVATLFIICIPKFEKLQKLLDKLNLTMREIITGIPVIRAFSNENHEEKRFDKVNQNLTKTSLFVDKTMSFMFPIMMFVMNATVLLIVYNGAKSIDAGLIQIGNMMAFIQYSMQIIMSFLMISIVSIMIPRAMVSVRRIDEVLAQKLLIKDNKENIKININNKKGIIFKDVYFKYSDADEYVLKNINFTAPIGKTTAFIGSTGSGKSTLINLIPRLFEPTSGDILIGGISIKDLNQEYLHNLIGYVPQKGILFSGTIASNIKYGNDLITNETMIKATDIASATEFINDNKNKYNSNISQGGTNVSGGQKQRLSIARAIAKNPEIYIFDDSFSALDFKTDAKVRNNLKKYTENKTTLIVGSRINTVMNADQIIVLDQGSIVGIGTHEELLKKCSIYYEIASSQLERGEL